jgi:hypothetical protein
VQNEKKEKLKSAILRLPPNFRDVVELQQTQEYSVKELAQVLGISLAAAKSRLSRARMALRASLRRNSFEPDRGAGPAAFPSSTDQTRSSANSGMPGLICASD